MKDKSLEPPDLSLAHLVSDWGGFEKLVARLHETGDVEVEHNVQLPSKSGGPYQIDVVLRSRQGPYTYLTIVECKYWNHSVGRDVINALAGVKEDVRADKAVCFTSKGFQSGALDAAKLRGIELFVVKDLVSEDWGLPGRVIDFYIQVCQPAISPILLPDCAPIAAPPFDAERLPLADAAGHPLLYQADGTTKGTLAFTAEQVRRVAWAEFSASSIRWAEDGVHYFKKPIHGAFEGGVRFFYDGDNWCQIQSFECEILYRVEQSRFVHDRAQSVDYGLIVENYVRGTKFLASRRKGAKLSQLVPHQIPVPDPSRDVFQNGSIARVDVAGWFDYETARQDVAAGSEFVWQPGGSHDA